MKALDIPSNLDVIRRPAINLAFVDNNAIQRIEMQNIVEALEELQLTWNNSSSEEVKNSFEFKHSTCKKNGDGCSEVEYNSASGGFTFNTKIVVPRPTNQVTYYFSGYYNGSYLDKLSLKTHNGKRFSHRTKMAEGTVDWFVEHYLKEIKYQVEETSKKSEVNGSSTIAQAVDLLKQIA